MKAAMPKRRRKPKAIVVHQDRFAPGPWIKRRMDSGDYVICAESQSCFYHAKVEDGGIEKETKANADLIESAPDLLAALRALVAEREYERVNGGGGERYWSPCNSDANRLADAAIAKAEGRAS